MEKMEAFPAEVENKMEKKEKIFSEYFSDGKMHEIKPEEVPAVAREYFESKSKQFIFKDNYIPNNFEELYHINDKREYSAYLARQTKTYDIQGGTEQLTYLVEINEEGKAIGFGELRFNISSESDYFKNKPLVGFTATEKDFQNKGVGLNRLRVMNALAHAFHGLPLHSDTNISDVAKNLWKKLVEDGMALQYKEGSHDRYMFKI